MFYNRVHDECGLGGFCTRFLKLTFFGFSFIILVNSHSQGLAEADRRKQVTTDDDKVISENQGSASYLREASRLKALRKGYPVDSPEEKRLKRLEAVQLLKAGFAGERDQEKQLAKLVREIRGDRSYSVEQRSEIVALYKNLGVLRVGGLSRDERIEAFVRVSREMVGEFGELSVGYESMLNLAVLHSEKLSYEVAKEILDNPMAPEFIKQEARVLVYRNSRLGKPISVLVSSVPDLRDALDGLYGKRVILYGWSLGDTNSMFIAKELSEKVSENISLVGLNMDEDVVAAESFAIESNLRGLQFYDASTTAILLTMQVPGMVFIVDESGVLVSVSAHRDLSDVVSEKI